MGEKCVKVMFSCNEYDSDGDVVKAGIFLHFGDVKVYVAPTVPEFRAFCERLKEMEKEIVENYRM